MSTPLEGSVRTGFGPMAAPGNAFRSQPFAANDLRTLVVDVQSLRSLQRLFDNEGACEDGWPFCVGRSAGRAGALSVRLVRDRDGKTLYDAALYWHMKEEEAAQHNAEEAAWAASIAGGSFGTRLTMGPQASVTYRPQDIVRLAETLGFDGNEVRLVSTQSSHVSAGEARSGIPYNSAPPGPQTSPPNPAPTWTPTPPTPVPTPPTPAPTPPAPTPPTPAPTMPTTPPGPATTPLPAPTTPTTNTAYPVCHQGTSLYPTTPAGQQQHVLHGDSPGPCPTAPPPAPAYAPPSSWNPTFYVCHVESNGRLKSKKIDSRSKYEQHVAGRSNSHRDPIRTGGSCSDD